MKLFAACSVPPFPMKTSRLTLVLLLALTSFGFARADQAAASRVEVNFSNPENFTDVKDSFQGTTDSRRDAILDEIKDYIVRRASARLPEGQHLSVTITDVDLAGDFEPWRGPSSQDVRVIKDIYTPKIDLSFTLTDASGKVVSEGNRKLRDLSFNMKTTTSNRNDPRVYEKALIDDWLRDDLPRAKR